MNNRYTAGFSRITNYAQKLQNVKLKSSIKINITMQPNLVSTTDFDIKGVNYYWTRKERYNISEEELRTAGVTNGNAYIDKSLIAALQTANTKFKKLGYEIIVKDGYRSPKLYQLIQKKRYETRGKEETDKLLNLETMPHSTGMVIDISLINTKTNEELMMRDSKDDSDGAFFIDYYKYKNDERSQEFQRRQRMMIDTMLESGFKLGTKNEYWHFEYRLK